MTQAYAQRRMEARQLRRLLESWETPDDCLLEYEELGELHFRSARGCSFCHMVMEIQNEREVSYEAQAKEKDRDVMEIYNQHEKTAAGWLLELEMTRTETTKTEMDVPQPDMDGWSLCGSEVSIGSDEEWGFELI